MNSETLTNQKTMNAYVEEIGITILTADTNGDCQIDSYELKAAERRLNIIAESHRSAPVIADEYFQPVVSSAVCKLRFSHWLTTGMPVF